MHDELGPPSSRITGSSSKASPRSCTSIIPTSSPRTSTGLQAEALLGYTQEEWGDPEHWMRVMHPDDADAVREENDRSNRDGQPFHAEYRIVAKDRRIVDPRPCAPRAR